MKYLECVDPGKSGWLEPGRKYVAIGWNHSCYWLRREGHPTGKIYSKKHFVETSPSLKQKIQAAGWVLFE